jgi:hypothetical protein
MKVETERQIKKLSQNKPSRYDSEQSVCDGNIKSEKIVSTS